MEVLREERRAEELVVSEVEAFCFEELEGRRFLLEVSWVLARRFEGSSVISERARARGRWKETRSNYRGIASRYVASKEGRGSRTYSSAKESDLQA